MKGKRLILFVSAVCLAVTTVNAEPLDLVSYDYHIPANIISSIALGMGGLNLTNAGDYFTSYDNPALLAGNNVTSFAASFRLKNEEEISLADAASASNLLKAKQFMYYTLITKNAAWSYQPTVSTHISEINANSLEYYDYQLDKLQLSLAGTDERYADFAAGINIKYLTGRLIYLKERIEYNQMIRESFIDDKVKGFSTDLGVTYTSGKYTFGSCVYDVLSRLWWEHYDSEDLQRRAAVGVQYSDGNLTLSGSLQGKLSQSTDTSYHLGLTRAWHWKSGKDKEQGLLVRAGLFSHDFNGTENINYTLGSGYNYNMFRFDFGLTNTGMRLKDSEFIFSLGIGI
ncbi:MAG TPA: hypothetical protein PKJ14_05585 [Candidatus Cloacimonadota bacterium]|nr:hypothetical protein [Candidatus Cloacimonadota bacterium]HQL15093.1 hypothetical protein [Candidatus Cloacimonadota bacterium]